ncbi:response regulator transcription factor [Pseudotenacibaculum sp. MALMAid0570]|uniref:LytR/AlgR family response regulator transcription factor n=1 Tax=Pseudotenacibaculum sp. MALMAid0570 TaxID=3143938 RepID=UPI0032DEF876
MEHLNVLIVEDTPQESKEVKLLLEKNGFNVVSVVTNYKDAIAAILNEDVDLLILDIFLNGNPDGINIAETIDAMPNKLKPFIFLTSSIERTIFERAKLTKPFAYMVKPFNELELVYTIEQAIERFYNQPNALSVEDENAVIGDGYLFIKKGKSLKKVHVSEIIYVEVEEKYCNIITQKEKFVILISLVKILDLLSTSNFCRTHRNFIVNTDKIVEIVPQDNLIILEGNHKATLSDKYKDIIKKIRTLR